LPDTEFLDSRGQRIEFHCRIGASWNPWPAESSVQVFYDPEDPTNAEIKPTRGMVLFVVGVISVLIVWFGLLEYLTVFREMVTSFAQCAHETFATRRHVSSP
jgi:hypothetical protein